MLWAAPWSWVTHPFLAGPWPEMEACVVSRTVHLGKEAIRFGSTGVRGRAFSSEDTHCASAMGLAVCRCSPSLLSFNAHLDRHV